MKQVLNVKNLAALQRLNDDLVAPLLDILCSAKAESVLVAFCSSFTSLPIEKRTVISVTWNQIVVPKSKTKSRVTFGEACNIVVSQLSLADLHNIAKVFQYQSQQLKLGNYSLTVVNFDDCVKTLFSDYLYTKLFDNEEIWAALKLPQLKRELFHENFRIDNNYPAACPYCDMDTINSSGSVKVEHFLPKSKFPLLSVYPLNLLSACESCNSGGFGKGSKVVNDLNSPYFEAIGDSVEFTFNHLPETVAINARMGKLGVEGFLKILNLEDRYQEVNVGKQIYRRMDSFISSVSYVPRNTADIRAYLEKNQGGAPFTVALIYWLDNIYIPASGI